MPQSVMPMPKIIHVIRDCKSCSGTGKVKVLDYTSLREARNAKKISLRKFAKQLGFTAPYLSDIELGRRNCTKQIEEAYSKL